MKKILAILFLILTNLISAQNIQYSGVVRDSLSGDPLPFVNIIGSQASIGTTTDINGVFVLKCDKVQEYLVFSSVGYKKDTLTILSIKSMNIRLRPSIQKLKEVNILSGENPAHRIINNAIANREKNDPLSLQSFKHKTHNKFFISAETDSIPKQDRLLKATKNLTAFLDTSYLFLMENISEKKYLYPNLMNENLIAVKTSGMKDPLFSMLMGQMQSFSFYKNLISISDKNYINPISKGATERYFFALEDSIFEGVDTVFVISFHPRKGKNFDGLKGLLYIISGDWAIKSVIAEPNGEESGFSVRIKQNYNKPDGKHWFPYQQHTIISFKDLEISGAPLYGKNISYIYDVQINPPLKKSDFPRATVSVEEDANSKKEEFWKSLRIDSLAQKDINTYKLIDSLGNKAGFDRSIGSMKAMMNGNIPWGIFDLPIRELIDFNDYEGFRIGFGLQTNHKVSKRIVFGGYFAYGLRDKEEKYGGRFIYKVGKLRQYQIRTDYKHDVSPIGLIFPKNNDGILSPGSFSNYFLKKMDCLDEYSIKFKGPLSRTIDFETGVRQYLYKFYPSVLFGQQENNAFIGSDTYDGLELMANFYFRSGNKIISQGNYQLVLEQESKKPELSLHFRHGFDDLKPEYTQLSARFAWDIKSRYLGSFHLRAWGAKLWGNVPLSFRFNIPGTFRNFSITAPETFETMRSDEFYSDQLAALFFTYRYKKLKFGKSSFHPIPEIGFRAAIGKMNHLESIKSYDFKIPIHPYTECYLAINQLLNLKFYYLGFSLAYRSGYYSNKTISQNFSYRISISYPL